MTLLRVINHTKKIRNQNLSEIIMQKSSTIAIVTGNRAEYYLLEPVILKLEKLPKVTTEVLVSGTHLENKEKGSLQDLRKNLNSQLRLIPIHSKNSTPSEVCIQISQAVDKFGQCFQNHDYDLLIVLGDRHEILAACIAALILDTNSTYQWR